MQSLLRYNRIDYTTAASCATLAASEPGLLERGQYKRIREARYPLLFSPPKSSTHHIQFFPFRKNKPATDDGSLARPLNLNNSIVTKHAPTTTGSAPSPVLLVQPSPCFPPTRTVETANRIVPSLGCSGSPPRSQSSLFRDGSGANR